MSDPVLKRLAAGLALDGFKLRILPAGPSFRGVVEVRGQAVALSLNYEGPDFSEPPRVFVRSPETLSPGVVAHLDEANELCVVDRRQYVADRYALAEQGRGIVQRAAEMLERGLTKAGPLEIAEEFPRHWGGKVVRVEFGPRDGFAEPFSDPMEKLRFRACAKPILAPNAGAVVVQTPVRLSFQVGQCRPRTFGEVLDWAGTWDGDLPAKLIDGLADLSPVDPYALIYAPNGIVAFEVKVSARGPRVMKSIIQPRSWRTLLGGQFGRNLPIERNQGQRVDTDYLLGTNSLTGTAPLAGRTVVLVGCGAIGGFLGFALAQLGAGSGGGSLLLIDNEALDPRNIVRHRLGADKVGSNKAMACKDGVEAAYAGTAVNALPLKVEQCRHRLMAADLVVDATGEQAVGDMINAWRLAQVATGAAAPDTLHAWVAGNGAAVQTYMGSDPAFGCFRCLQPDLLLPPRFPVLRPDADIRLATGCGEAPFSPYGPAAPMSAAALAANHAKDWATGAPRPLLRTLRLSYDETVERKPTNPSKSDRCPACHGH
jgi:hypothetical protein